MVGPLAIFLGCELPASTAYHVRAKLSLTYRRARCRIIGKICPLKRLDLVSPGAVAQFVDYRSCLSTLSKSKRPRRTCHDTNCPSLTNTPKLVRIDQSKTRPRVGEFNLSDSRHVTPIPTPEQGQIVSVRNRRWSVLNVRPSSLPAPEGAPPSWQPQNVVHLSSLDDDAYGEELEVVWEIEPGAKIEETAGALPDPREGFDDPREFEAYLHAVQWGAISQFDLDTQTEAGRLQAPFRSGIHVQDYQLDPLVRALQMPRISLLIADDVGLGKTIEAGLIAQELVLRHRARRVLIVCPAGLQVQWREQMRDKFGLRFRILDSTFTNCARSCLAHRVRGFPSRFPSSPFPRGQPN